MNRRLLASAIGLVASMITILVFITGRNLPDILTAFGNLQEQHSRDPGEEGAGKPDVNSDKEFKLSKIFGRRDRGSTSMLSLQPDFTLVGTNYDQLSFSPDGTRLAVTTGWKSPAIVWDTAARKIVGRLPSAANWIMGLDFDPSGGKIATAHSNKKVKIWSTSGQLLDTLDMHWPAFAVAFSPDGKFLGVGGAYEAVVWNLNARKVWAKLEGLPYAVRAVTFSPDGKVIAANDLPAKLWELSPDFPNGFRFLRQIGLRCDPKDGLSFSYDGEYLAGACDGGVIWVSRAHSGELVQWFRLGDGPYPSAVKFSPRSYYFAAAGNDRIELRNATSSTPLRTIVDPRGNASWSLAFSADGRQLAAVANRYRGQSEIKVWSFYEDASK